MKEIDKTMKTLNYFQKGLLLSIPIATFIIVRESLEFEFETIDDFLIIIAKGLVIGLISGVILGLLNMIFKYDTFYKKKDK